MDANDTQYGQDGVICSQAVKITAITDGTSSTIMFGEFSNFEPNWSTWSSMLLGDNIPLTILASGWPSGFSSPNGSTFYPINPRLPAAVPADPLVVLQIANRFDAYGSRHTGGANFTLADGSVRFITEGVNNNPALFSGLGTRAGGEIISVNY